MNKSRANHTIDPLILMQFNNRVPERERSQLIERFMRTYVETEGYQSVEENQLQERHASLKEQAQTILGEIALIEVQLQSLEQKRKTATKVQREEGLQALHALKANPALEVEE